MATKFKSQAVVIRTKSPTVSKATYEQLRTRSAAVAKRLKTASRDDTEAVVGIVSGIGLAMYEKSGNKLPTMFGVDPAIVWGAGAWFLTRGSASQLGSAVHAAGLALATIGTNRSAMRGSMRVQGVDDGYDDDDDDTADL